MEKPANQAGEEGQLAEASSTAPTGQWRKPSTIQAGAVILAGLGALLLAVQSDNTWTGKKPVHEQPSAGAAEEQESPPQSPPAANPVNHAATLLNLCREGTELAKQGKSSEAIARFQAALQLDPRCAAAHGNLGSALLEKGEIAKAEAHLQEAIRLNPAGAVDAHFSLGWIRIHQEEFPQAADHFEQVVRVKPDDVQARFNLGLALDKQGKLAEAVEQYREVVRRQPGNLQVCRQLAWYLAGHPELALQHPDEAIQLAERVSRATKNRDPLALDTLAAAYARAGRFEDAAAVAANAAALAKTQWKADAAKEIESRLQLYQSKQPYGEQSSPVRQ